MFPEMNRKRWNWGIQQGTALYVVRYEEGKWEKINSTFSRVSSQVQRTSDVAGTRSVIPEAYWISWKVTSSCVHNSPRNSNHRWDQFTLVSSVICACKFLLQHDLCTNLEGIHLPGKKWRDSNCIRRKDGPWNSFLTNIGGVIAVLRNHGNRKIHVVESC